MSNEAVLRDRFSDPVDFTCADGTGMEKGTIVFLSGARTVAPSAATGNAAIGVLAREKIALDGRTQVPVYLDGIFDCTFQGLAISGGSSVSISGSNILKFATPAEADAGLLFGKVLETVAAGTTVNQVLVGVY